LVVRCGDDLIYRFDRVWAMNHSEIRLWEGMLRCAIAAAGTVSVTSAVVVEMVLHRLGERKVNRYVKVPVENTS
jgi:hypothetical protein